MFKIISHFNEIHLHDKWIDIESLYIFQKFTLSVNSLMIESRLYRHKNRSYASICDFFAYDVVIEDKKLIRNNS